MIERATIDVLATVGKEMRREERLARSFTANRVRLGIGRLLGFPNGLPNIKDWEFTTQADLGHLVVVLRLQEDRLVWRKDKLVKTGRFLGITIHDKLDDAFVTTHVHPFQGSALMIADNAGMHLPAVADFSQTYLESINTRARVEAEVTPIIDGLEPYHFSE